jgi:uncharacterized protein YecE (DUF72 family)
LIIFSSIHGYMAKQGQIRVGISGWSYRPWRGTFYPDRLPLKLELAYAAEHFSSIEINGTFYRLQRPEHFARWYDSTPVNFLYSVKGPRFITHMLKLRDIKAPLANFLASGLLRLGPKLGPILWQFPPQMTFEPDRFDAFFELLPQDTEEAIKLARQHDARLNGRSWLRSEVRQRMRHVVEIRHHSFCTPRFAKLLRRHKVALACADTVAWPRLMDLTSDFVYCRLHGSKELYVSGYGPAALEQWAKRIRTWASGDEPEDAHRISPATRRRSMGRDVFVYFDNDAKVRAPADAEALIKRVQR